MLMQFAIAGGGRWEGWQSIASLAALFGVAIAMTSCAPADDRELRSLGPVGVPPSDTGAVEITFTSHVHAMPVRSTLRSRPQAPGPGARLRNHGGKIIETPKVVQVLYGGGTYLPQLTNAPPPNMASAYREMVTTSVFGWLYEYNTESPTQRIGRGQVLEPSPIEPAASRNRTLITDADVQTELALQIAGGTLLGPDANTIYMVHFPRGKTNVAPDGALSCSQFCAYHGTFRIGPQNVYYSVLPDLSADGCATGC
jgi:hypothetical protein